MNKKRSALWVLLLTQAAFGLTAYAAGEGTTIIGTKESPTVLNVVPWQNVELNLDAWDIRPAAASSVLDDSLNPIDKEVLRREVDYFNLLQGSVSGSKKQ